MSSKDNQQEIVKDIQEEIKDTMHRKYMITINEPLKKGYTHNVINNLLQTKFKSILYYCFAEEKGSRHHVHIYAIFKNRGSLLSNKEDI